MSVAPVIRFYVRGRNPSRLTIWCEVNRNGEKKSRFSTGVKVRREDWNGGKGSFKWSRIDSLRHKYDTILKVEARLFNLFWTYFEEGNILNPSRLVSRFKVEMEGGKKLPKTMSEVVEELINLAAQQVKIGAKRPNTLKDLRAFQSYWSEYVQASHSEEPYMVDFDEQFFLDYAQYSVERGDMPSTTNDKRIKWLKTGLNHAYLKEYVPVDLAKRIKRRKYVVVRPFFTGEDVQFLFEKWKNGGQPKVLDLILLGCFTGLRYGDLKSADWTQLKASTSSTPVLLLRMEKTGKPLKLPISPKAMEVLKACSFNPPYPNWGQTFNSTAKEFLSGSERFREERKDWLTMEQYRLDQVFSAHCMRRTFATMQVANGMSLETLKKYLGHSFVRTAELYVQLESVEDFPNNEFL